jgi:NADPH2:quinone reductase
MSDAYRFCLSRTGGPEVLALETIAPPIPEPGEVLVRHESIGLNFIDTYHRSGLYPVSLPSGLGLEAVGLIEAVGEGVNEYRTGNRVGYFSGPLGAYSSHRVIPADRLVRIPDGVESSDAAALMLKGCTAEMLIERCARIVSGDTVLVHSAAGGVGSILVPWLQHIGARVIAHAGSSVKAARAKELGADAALNCPYDELAAEVRRLTNGKGVQAVFDGVGAASWSASLGSVARRGLVVSYGNASGPAPAVSPLELARAGSVFLTRPTLFDYVATADELAKSAARLFELAASGVVRAQIGQTFPLREAAEAHRALEARRTTGSTVLIP